MIPIDSIKNMNFIDRIFKDKRRNKIPDRFIRDTICGKIAQSIGEDKRYYYYHQGAYKRIPPEHKLSHVRTK